MINFRKYLPFLLYSCKRVSEIISKDKSERTLKERLVLSYHEFICKACHNYQIQNDLMDNSLANTKASTETATLSSQKKSEIIKLLEKEAS
jgi:guanylate kinase